MKTKIKQLIILLTILPIMAFASEVSKTGKGESAGEAYSDAMSKAPSGYQWKVKSVSKRRGGGGYYCTVVWTDK